MYTREEILNNYKSNDFPKSLFDETALNNKNILFYQNSKPPSSSIDKDTSSLSQSYILPRRLLYQKNYLINNNNHNKIEFSRGSNFTPITPKEQTIDIKYEKFKDIYIKFSIPLETKVIYLKNNDNISGPFNYEELENMYKNKKYDSNYEFRTIDLFTYSEEEPFIFHPLKNINEDNWEINYVDTPLLEYSALFSKVRELLEASKKRKNEINSLNEEITELKNQSQEKDDTINELKTKINNLEKELIEQKELVNELQKKESPAIKEQKEEDKKEENKPPEEQENKIEVEEINVKVEKNFLYSVNDNKKPKKKKKKKEKIIEDDEKEEKEEIIEKEKVEIEIKPKVLDMGEEWEIAGKKKTKIEKIKEEPKEINSNKKEEIKSLNDTNKNKGSNKTKKISNEIPAEKLVEMLRPKKKEIIKNEDEEPKNEIKQAKGKGKKKGKKQFADINIDLGFKY